MKQQSGFTLIELVMVIVILGILAATALPKFVDLQGDARKAAAEAVAGNLGSASAINYAASIAKGAVDGALLTAASSATAALDVTACSTTVAALLVDGISFDATAAGAYNVAYDTGSAAPTTVGETETCKITNNDDSNAIATFTLIAAK